VSVPELIDLISQEAQRGQWLKRLQQLCKPKLLILDDMGYLPLERPIATFLFQLVAKRYEKGAIIRSSNKSFSEWGELFTDQVVATALLDRLRFCRKFSYGDDVRCANPVREGDYAARA
jgi:DNA replication protein DnaC